MTAQHPQRLALRRLGEAGEIFTDGVTATVADDARSILVRVSRPAEIALAGTGDLPSVVAIDGEIDQDTAPLVRLALTQALDGRLPVCCDLSRVTFFGAAAANAVLAAHRQATAAGNVFFLRGVHGITGRVLAIVDPDRVLSR
jgi:anti-anti-sigma factor